MARWRDRWRHDPSADEPTLSAPAIRSAILELSARREEAAAAAAGALLNQAQVQQALHEQRRQLALAQAQLTAAIELAQRVADETERDDGALAAEPYRRNVEGLQSQADVLGGFTNQIDGLRQVSGSQVDAARVVLARSRAQFDAALHEQLTLLVALERLERARLIMQARAAARRPDHRP